MTRGRILFLAASLTGAALLVAGSWLAAQEADESPAQDSPYRYMAVFNEAFRHVRGAYVDEVSVEKLFAAAFDGVADALDPFSVYVPAAGRERFEATRRVGTGRSGIALLKERGVPYVVGVDAGSPGAAAGVEPGDLVAEVDGRPTRSLPLWEIESALAQPAGRSVRLRLVRLDQPQDVTVKLAEYTAPRPELVFEGGAEGGVEVAVLRLPAIDRETVDDVRRLLGLVAERGVARLLVDVRKVHRGDPEAAFAVAALFAAGDLGSLRVRDQEVRRFAGAPPIFAGKLVVLIDHSTIGPGEVLAQVLRQAAGARLVGGRSFGWAGRSTPVPLASGGLLVLTDGFFAAADGARIAEGLRPDVPVDERARPFAERDTPREVWFERRALETLRQVEPDAARPDPTTSRKAA